MAYLATPTATAEIIKKYGFAFQKKFGQNFLIDANIVNKIIGLSEITKTDCVVEIGPGIGTMTQYLAEKAGQVIAVEIDKNLIPILNETLGEYDNVTVINDDILKVDIRRIVEQIVEQTVEQKAEQTAEQKAEEKNVGRPIKIVANLPYYITTPIIMGLFESNIPLSSITIMVQKEVAERMQVGPGTKDYGALSLAVQYYARPEIVLNVPSTCFMPRPGVGSAVIRLQKYETPPVNVKDEKKMFSMIRAAFNQRRKTLANALTNGFTYKGPDGNPVTVSRQDVYNALEKMNLSQSIRGEVLCLEQFAELSDLL